MRDLIEKIKKAQEESKKIKTINIIPENYEGNPKEALGYSHGGEDIIIKQGDSIEEIIKERFGGNVKIQDCSGYGWMETTPGKIIARINCMWCGGITGIVYIPDVSEEQQKGNKRNVKIAGGTTEETSAHEYISEKINLAEQDKEYIAHPGYCTRCHSFCYGDCAK